MRPHLLSLVAKVSSLEANMEKITGLVVRCFSILRVVSATG